MADNDEEPKPLYGHQIMWNDFGAKRSVSVCGFDTPEEAFEAALKVARISGWTYPRWWEIWRWGENYRGGFYTQDYVKESKP